MGLTSDKINLFDREGFLIAQSSWTPELAEEIANKDGIKLTDQHWEIILLVRRYHEEFDSPPAMRALVKYVRFHLGEPVGNSIYLLKLFPNSPAKTVCKISGLSKPPFCL